MATISLLALLLGCPSPIGGEFRQARDAALADPGPAGPDWQPDAALHLSPALLDAAIRRVLESEGDLDAPFEVAGPLGFKATVRPALTVDRLTLSSSDRCASCLAVDTTISGDVAWDAGVTRGTVPVTAKVGLDAEFAANLLDLAWVVTVTPNHVRRVDLVLGRSAASLPKAIESRLEKRIEEQLAQRFEPFVVGEFGAEGVPLRGMKLAPSPRGLTVAMLTASPTPRPLAVVKPKILDGWQLDISQESLLGLAKAAAFRAGPVARGVVVEPTSLDIGRGAFAMDIRLWMPKGRGWWRDYTVDGALDLKPKGIALRATGVVEGEKSPGAAVVDPLVALAEGYILKAIEESFAASMPRTQRSSARGLTTEVHLDTLVGAGGVLTAKGSLEVTQGTGNRAGRPDAAPRPAQPRGSATGAATAPKKK